MNKKILYLGILLGLLSTTAANSARLYKVVNEDGTVTYTDQYQANAQEIDLSSTNSAVMPPFSTPAKSINRLNKVEKKGPEYKLTFIALEHKQTIRNNAGRLVISAELSTADNLPVVPNGEFQLIIDGQLIQSKTVPTFTIQNLDRGEHTVQIKLIQQTGKILASTETLVFYLKQASKLINPN